MARTFYGDGESFEELKLEMLSAPLLTLPISRSSGGFQLYSDASKKGFGCVLMKHGRFWWLFWRVWWIEYNLLLQIKEVKATVSPSEEVKRFGIKGKLSPRFIGPFEILEHIGEIQPDMSLSEEPESILDRQERVMRNKVIPFVKILWKNHPEREATWETEESMRASYPHFFV
ncbi:putative nucleotidyltransferase, ribonuclease H [Tanacetum coccineum]